MNTNIPLEILSAEFRQILGIRFFVGEAQRAIHLLQNGGLLVVPAAPALKNLAEDRDYRDALLGADVAIADSGLMVMIWNLLQKDHIRRLSGLKYLRELLRVSDIRQTGQSLWIMPSIESAATNLAWLRRHGLEISFDDIYLAPMYGDCIEDEALLRKIRDRRPAHVIVAIGGGTQERLGLYLKNNLSPVPAIHCLGAAIAFLSGDQVRIPNWADRLYLGWLFRCISEPTRFIPRYWSARKLIGLMLRYREALPEASSE
jgi:N-acetylglucosaminyldiphosphoundecaprenol N-acetyl-beta-D-mannosaminyltransferase